MTVTTKTLPTEAAEHDVELITKTSGPDHELKSVISNFDHPNTATAPLRREHRSKPLEEDNITELSNAELKLWTSEYHQNMSIARRQQEMKVSMTQARRNASFWMNDQGIGGVQTNFADDAVLHPFAVFSGPSLLHLLGQHVSATVGTKRPYEEPVEEESARNSSGIQSERRVRSRSEGHDVPRGDVDALLVDNGEGMTFGDEVAGISICLKVII